MYRHIIKASLYAIKETNFIFEDTHKNIETEIITTDKDLNLNDLFFQLVIQYEEETKTFCGIYIVHVCDTIDNLQINSQEIRKISIITKPNKTEYFNSDGTIDRNKFHMMSLHFLNNDNY